MLLFEEGENQSSQRKNSQSKDKNQQQTQPTSDVRPGIKPGPQWCEASWVLSVLTSHPCFPLNLPNSLPQCHPWFTVFAHWRERIQIWWPIEDTRRFLFYQGDSWIQWQSFNFNTHLPKFDGNRSKNASFKYTSVKFKSCVKPSGILKGNKIK